MPVGYLLLLCLMVLEYNDLANTTPIASAPPNFDSNTEYEEAVCQQSSDTDDIEMELDEIEIEIIVLLNL